MKKILIISFAFIGMIGNMTNFFRLYNLYQFKDAYICFGVGIICMYIFIDTIIEVFYGK